MSVFPLARCILHKFQVEVSSGRANQQCLFLHLWIYSSFTGMLQNCVHSVATQSWNKFYFVFPRLCWEQNPALPSAVLKLLSDYIDRDGYPCHILQTHFKRPEWVLCLFPRRGSRCLNPEFQVWTHTSISARAAVRPSEPLENSCIENTTPTATSVNSLRFPLFVSNCFLADSVLWV